jgi:hypothetical protein
MTAHNLLLHERSRQEQAKQLRFRKLFHIGRPVTVLSVALLAATAVMGSTINTMRYLDSISAALPVPTTHRVTARRSVNTQTLCSRFFGVFRLSRSSARSYRYRSCAFN